MQKEAIVLNSHYVFVCYLKQNDVTDVHVVLQTGLLVDSSTALTICTRMQCEEEDDLRGIFRMDISSFESLLTLIQHKISKFRAT